MMADEEVAPWCTSEKWNFDTTQDDAGWGKVAFSMLHGNSARLDGTITALINHITYLYYYARIFRRNERILYTLSINSGLRIEE